MLILYYLLYLFIVLFDFIVLSQTCHIIIL